MAKTINDGDVWWKYRESESRGLNFTVAFIVSLARLNMIYEENRSTVLAKLVLYKFVLTHGDRLDQHRYSKEIERWQ